MYQLVEWRGLSDLGFICHFSLIFSNKKLLKFKIQFVHFVANLSMFKIIIDIKIILCTNKKFFQHKPKDCFISELGKS